MVVNAGDLALIGIDTIDNINVVAIGVMMGPSDVLAPVYVRLGKTIFPEFFLSFDHSSSTPLYQQVEQDIRRKIASGEFPVGMQLEPHRALAVSYGVSIITINKALSGLVSEGVLHSRVGRGTFVAAKPFRLQEGQRGPPDARLRSTRSGQSLLLPRCSRG